MTTITLPNGWSPRPYQRRLWSYLRSGGLRADVAWHRRAGKDDVSLHWAAIAAMKRPGAYWHMLPEATQARKAIWDAVNPHTGKRRIDEAFPHALRETTREQDMLIRFVNGSTWQVVGSDNYNSLVGSSTAGIVFSEWSLARPEAWAYFRPILAENGGWAVFIWTPRGRNHATRAFEFREQDPEWFTQRLGATETGVFSADQLAKERAELIAECGSEEEGDAKFRQEYLVDFDAAVPGSYFGPQMSKAKDEGRIGVAPYDPALPVSTAWDIGVDDYTAIWFLQENGKQVRAIDYFEVSGEGAEGIIRLALPEHLKDESDRQAALELTGRAVPYRYDAHFLPHDVRVREWGAGAKTRYETLLDLGLKNIRIGVATEPGDRVNAVRRILPVVSFDARRCAVGLDRLRNYRKRWNPSLSVYTGPLHDENSHGSDAFGEFAINCMIVPKPEKPANEQADRYARRKSRQGGASAWAV